MFVIRARSHGANNRNEIDLSISPFGKLHSYNIYMYMHLICVHISIYIYIYIYPIYISHLMLGNELWHCLLSELTY